MDQAKKITVHVSEKLLKQAQKSTGQGISETIRRGLQLVAAASAYRELRQLRGKVSISVDIGCLREDRT